jgi:hypothetical protein
MDADNLGLRVQSKNGGVAETIAGFEEVIPYHVIVGHMAIVARGDGVMAAGPPRSELGAHDVAVDADFRTIREVTRRF